MTDMQINIEEIIRSTRRYWYVDGVVEITGGEMMALCAFALMLISKISASGFNLLVTVIFLPALVLGGSLLARKYVTLFKQNVTYPRTGYLTFRRPRSASNNQMQITLGILVAFTVSAVVSAFSSLIPKRYLLILIAVFLGANTWYLDFYNGIRRFNVVTVSTVICGILIGFLELTGIAAPVYLLTAAGVIWVISGCLTFLHYPKQTQLLAGET